MRIPSLQALYKGESGQALLLSVMVIGGVLIGATAIAGVLMTYQIRQTNDVVNSTKAFFAADAGIERETYNINVPVASLQFSNGAAVTSSWAIAGPDVVVRAQGTSGGAVRALESFITAAASSSVAQPQITMFAVSASANLVNDPCSGSCAYHTGNPDTSAPIVGTSTITIAWASENTLSCTGSSNPAGIWSTNTLSGSQAVNIGEQVPPITFSLACSSDSISVSTSTVINFVP